MMVLGYKGFAQGYLFKYDVKICTFWCILTAINGLVLELMADRTRRGGGGIPHNFLSVLWPRRQPVVFCVACILQFVLCSCRISLLAERLAEKSRGGSSTCS